MPKQCGFSRARRAANDDALAGCDGEIDVAQRVVRAEPFVDADEFDDGVEAFTWITEDKARAKATLHIEDLADELKIEIDKEDFEDVDTIGGLMAQKLGRVPIAGSTTSMLGWSITSERPIGRRRKISSVIIERIKDGEVDEHE